MALTYEPIATASTAQNVTFSNIPQTYTDLVLVAVDLAGSSDTQQIWIKPNNDTGTTYSMTCIRGTGASVLSQNATNTTGIYAYNMYNVGGQPQFLKFDIFNYAGSTFKTILVEGSADGNGSGEVNRTVGLWRSTSAITSIAVVCSSGQSHTGTLTLYGIKSA